MKKYWKIVIIVAIILAVLVAGFFSFRAYQNSFGGKALQAGYNAGYQRAVFDVMNNSLDCQPFPVYGWNASVNLINVDCLQQAPQ